MGVVLVAMAIVVVALSATPGATPSGKSSGTSSGTPTAPDDDEEAKPILEESTNFELDDT
jgi:hypothetical protein